MTPMAANTSCGTQHAPTTATEGTNVVTYAETAEGLLDAALAAGARGWHVFPLVPAGKRPAVRDWQARATTETERIRRCWTPSTTNRAGWNVGVACGPSRLLVLDLDVVKLGEAVPPEYQACGFRTGGQVLADLEGAHGELPETLMVATPSGGEHWYFTAPEGVRLGNTAGRLGWKIDTRGVGGYVVGPGSHVDGHAYRIVADLALASLPEWIGECLRHDPAEVHATPTLPAEQRRRVEYVAAAVRGELARILSRRNLAARTNPAARGSRNSDLYKAASQLGQLVATGDLDQGIAHAALVAAGEAIGLDTTEAHKTAASGLRNGLSKPRTEHTATPGETAA